MVDSQETHKFYEKAVKLLSIRMHTSFELARKLKLKGANQEVIDEVMLKLAEMRYINDSQVAASYLDSLIRHKTFGFYGLKSKLMQKGIPAEVAENLLNENLTIEIEEEIAKKYLTKNRLSGVKAQAGLSRKGFRGEVIRKLVITN